MTRRPPPNASRKVKHEDRLDAIEAAKRLADPKAKFIPWEKAKRRLLRGKK